MADETVFKLKYEDTVSSLAQAAHIGNVRVVKSLLQKGRLPQTPDNRGWSAVHLSVAANQMEVLKLMLNFRKTRKKYLANLSTWEGESPLIIAAKCDVISLEVVRFLLQSGANPKAATNEGMTALHYACQKNNNINVVKMLVQYGAAVDAAELMDGFTPLHYAIIKARDAEMVKFLVDHGDVNLPNFNSHTPLYLACICNFTEAAEFILSEDVTSVNATPANNASPLSVAALHGNEKLVKLLLRAGADTEFIGSGGNHKYPLNESNTMAIHLSLNNFSVFKTLLKVMNVRTLLNHEKIVSLGVYAMMHAPNAKCFEILLQTQFPYEFDSLRIVDSDRLTDFILHCPLPGSELSKKLRQFLKYCIHLQPERIFKYLANGVTDHSQLKGKHEVVDLLAEIGISSTNAFGEKAKMIFYLEQLSEERERISKAISLLGRPVLTLKQMSRVATRKVITGTTESSWAAYSLIRDSSLPSSLKEYLCCCQLD